MAEAARVGRTVATVLGVLLVVVLGAHFLLAWRIDTGFVAERLGCVAVGASICQILMSCDRCSYASRFPRLERAGFAALSPPTNTGSGLPPDAETLQRLLLDSGAPRLDENTNSRPLAVQARRSQNGIWS